MADIPIIYPRRGLNEAWSASDTPAEFSQAERNMSTRDPISGRLRGGKRPGYSKFCSVQIDASSKVKRIGTVIYDVPNITFANKSQALTFSDVDDFALLPSLSAGGKRNVSDRYGSVYVIDGRAGVVKYTAKIGLEWRINLPTAEEDHEVRALWVDEFLNVYAGVTFGTKHENARLWKFAPDLTDGSEPKLAWTWSPGGFVMDIRERNGRLYYIVNFPDTGKAHIVALTGLDRFEPVRVFTQPQAPYPINGLSIDEDGNLFTCHEPVALVGRGKNPQAPDADAVFVSWTPYDLSEFQARVHAWHAADNVDGLGNTTVPDGGDVLRWYDLSGKGRHYYAALGETYLPDGDAAFATMDTPVSAPTLDLKAQAGRPGVRFDGVSALMRSAPAISDSYNARDTQGPTVPWHRLARDTSGATIANTGSAYLVVMAVKIDLDEPATVARFLWSHEDADNGNDRHMLVNRTDTALIDTDLSATDKGRFNVWETTAGATGHGNGNHPDSSNASGDAGLDDGGGSPAFGDAFDNTSGVAIISYLCDGGFQSGTYDSSTTHSFLRINGRPIDRYRSEANFTTKPDYIGGTGIPDASLPNPVTGNIKRFFKGWVLERIVLTRKPINLSAPTTEDIIIEHTKYGNSTTPVSGDTDWPGAAVEQTDTELAKLEAYMGDRWGKKASIFPNTNTEYGHPYRADLALAPSQPATFNVNNLQVARGILAKWAGDSGSPIWSVDALAIGGGVGYAVEAAPNGIIYSYGPSNGSAIFACRIDDAGSIPTISGGSTWQSALGMSTHPHTFTDRWPKMAVDINSNLYVPIVVDPSSGTSPVGAVYVFKSDGTILHTWDPGAPQISYAVSVPPFNPPYPSSLTNQRPTHFFSSYVGSGNDIARVRMVTETVNTSAPRIETHIAVAGANVKKFTTSAVTTPSNGTGAVDASARNVELITAFEKIYILDGKNYRFFDPQGLAGAGVVGTWEATKGEIPPRCRIGCLWNGRIVLARGDDPDLVYMSAKGDPLDWDRQPLLQVVTQAIFVEDLRLGAVPDIVTALIPADNNTLIIGGDHSIRRIVGEPLVQDQYDLISDQVGISSNTAWTKDPEGRIYIHEAQEGRIRILGANGAQSISNTIPERLRSIDLTVNFVHLEWSTRRDGLYVYVCPIGTPTVVIERYFWERQVDAWHPETVSGLTKLPTTARSIDGDEPGDRMLLVGTSDGYILKEDDAALTDDGLAIDSFVRIGPIAGSSTSFETRFTGLEIVLADNQGGAWAKWYGSNEPDVLGKARHQKLLRPGRNSRWPQKVCAAHVWLEIGSALTTERFAFESGMMRGYRAGRLRSKARENTVGT